MIRKEELKINVGSYFNSSSFLKKIDLINDELENLKNEIGKLMGAIQKHKRIILDTIGEYKSDINHFLDNAGFDYLINEEEFEDSYRIVLTHKDKDTAISNSRNRLSFGERNAFAIILFMFRSLKKNADLIVLDDPISSFDKNKKFAIVNRLFNSGNDGLRGKTVVMLTHDFEPIIDIVRNCLPSGLQKDEYQSHFLTNNLGILKEKPIGADDIKSSLDICLDNIRTLTNDINKLVYLRRLCEIDSRKDYLYQMLSSLFKKKPEPLYKKYNSQKKITEFVPFSLSDKSNTEKEIEKYIGGFKYDDFLTMVNDDTIIMNLFNDASSSNYERLQLYRICKGEESYGDKTIRKFINESYHIENDSLFQLNPCHFETIPNYIIEKCEQDLGV